MKSENETKWSQLKPMKKIKKMKPMVTHDLFLKFKVCVGKGLYQDFEIYIHKILSQINSDVDNVFVTYYGKILESGGISKQINSVWQKAGVYGDNPPPVKKNITANVFRKSGSTATEEMQGDQVMYVDSLLCQSCRTPGKHHRLTQPEKNAIRGTKVLEEVFSRKIKVEWDRKKTDELQAIFMQNLESQKVTVEDVHGQSFKFKELKGIQEKQIVDKIRSYWRNSGKVSLLKVPS